MIAKVSENSKNGLEDFLKTLNGDDTKKEASDFGDLLSKLQSSAEDLKEELKKANKNKKGEEVDPNLLAMLANRTLPVDQISLKEILAKAELSDSSEASDFSDKSKLLAVHKGNEQIKADGKDLKAKNAISSELLKENEEGKKAEIDLTKLKLVPASDKFLEMLGYQKGGSFDISSLKPQNANLSKPDMIVSEEIISKEAIASELTEKVFSEIMLDVSNARSNEVYKPPDVGKSESQVDDKKLQITKSDVESLKKQIYQVIISEMGGNPLQSGNLHVKESQVFVSLLEKINNLSGHKGIKFKIDDENTLDEIQDASFKISILNSTSDIETNSFSKKDYLKEKNNDLIGSVFGKHETREDQQELRNFLKNENSMLGFDQGKLAMNSQVEKASSDFNFNLQDTAKPSIKTDFKNLNSEIVKHVSLSSDLKGGNSFKINLVPEKLGALELKVVTKGNTVDVSITAQKPETKLLIENEIGKLKEQFKSANLEVNKIEIMTKSDFSNVETSNLKNLSKDILPSDSFFQMKNMSSETVFAGEKSQQQQNLENFNRQNGRDWENYSEDEVGFDTKNSRKKQNRRNNSARSLDLIV